MQARAGILLANQPDIQRRFDRLNGVVGSGGNPVSSLMAYLPGLVEGGTLSMAGSLAQIERLAGVGQPSRFTANSVSASTRPEETQILTVYGGFGPPGSMTVTARSYTSDGTPGAAATAIYSP